MKLFAARSTKGRQTSNGCRRMRQVPPRFVVTWGQVRLDAVDHDAATGSAQDKSLHLGELVDALGDPRCAAQERLPIYRIVGGAGYIYAANFACSPSSTPTTPPPCAVKDEGSGRPISAITPISLPASSKTGPTSSATTNCCAHGWEGTVTLSALALISVAVGAWLVVDLIALLWLTHIRRRRP